MQLLLESIDSIATEQAFATVPPEPFSDCDMFEVGNEFEKLTKNKLAMLGPVVSDMVHTVVDLAMIRRPLAVDLTAA